MGGRFSKMACSVLLGAGEGTIFEDEQLLLREGFLPIAGRKWAALSLSAATAAVGAQAAAAAKGNRGFCTVEQVVLPRVSLFHAALPSFLPSPLSPSLPPFLVPSSLRCAGRDDFT